MQRLLTERRPLVASVEGKGVANGPHPRVPLRTVALQPDSVHHHPVAVLLDADPLQACGGLHPAEEAALLALSKHLRPGVRCHPLALEAARPTFPATLSLAGPRRRRMAGGCRGGQRQGSPGPTQAVWATLLVAVDRVVRRLHPMHTPAVRTRTWAIG